MVVTNASPVISFSGVPSKILTFMISIVLSGTFLSALSADVGTESTRATQRRHRAESAINRAADRISRTVCRRAIAAPAKKTHTAAMVELIKFYFFDVISFSSLMLFA